MKKIILLFLLNIIFSNNIFAQNHSKNVRCEASASRALSRNHDICITTKDEGAYHRCNIDMWEAFRRSTCSNYGRSSASNQIFISNRMISNYEDSLDGKISIDLKIQQRRQLFKMSADEFDRMGRFIDGELDDMEQSQSVRRSFNFFEQSIRLLGGGIGGGNQTPGLSTYILNGRVITCSNMGAIVNCN